MKPEEALDALDGDGVMWRGDYGLYFLRNSHTQDTVRIPKETAEAIIPKLQHYTRFGQDRWYRPTLEKYKKMLNDI